MNGFTEEQLQTVFRICQPNAEGRISARNLKKLFNKYATKGGRSSGGNEEEDEMSSPDRFLSYDEFKHLVLNKSLHTQQDEDTVRQPNTSSEESKPSSGQRSVEQNQQSSSKPTATGSNKYPSRQKRIPNETSRMPPPPTSLDLMSNVSLTDNQPPSLTDSAIGSSTSPEVIHKSQCSSLSDRDEENFESFGENDDVEYENDNDIDNLDGGRIIKGNNSPLSDRNFVRRNAWLRTSLRRSPGSNNSELIIPPRRWGSLRYSNKRVGSNAFASALYNNGSSPSGRSSNGDDGDMQSDISLEEDVNDLNQKVQMLQEQVGVLVQSQATTDDKYTKVKQENSSLTSRIHMLEEHIRELENRSEERVEDEQRRNKELIVRLERERQLENENYAMRLQTLEKENGALNEENRGLRSQLDRCKTDSQKTEELLNETQYSYNALQKEFKDIQESNRKDQETFSIKNLESSQLIQELYKETETLKGSIKERDNDNFNGLGSQDGSDDVFGDLTARIGEMEKEIRLLREKNVSLTDANEELQAQMLNRGLEEGKILLNGPSDDSLAAEFEAMNENEENEGLAGSSEYNKIRNALKEQQEVNTSLRRYIDGILMNIMEKYPELLEVRK